MYVCFPFKTEHTKWLLDKPGTLIEPGNQLPVTCCDYYCVEKGVILTSDDYSLSINTLDTPMAAFDKIKLWEYTTSIENKGSLFSWVLNNKWETNFRTDCAGYLESRYVINLAENQKQAEIDLANNELNNIVVRK